MGTHTKSNDGDEARDASDVKEASERRDAARRGFQHMGAWGITTDKRARTRRSEQASAAAGEGAITQGRREATMRAQRAMRNRRERSQRCEGSERASDAKRTTERETKRPTDKRATARGSEQATTERGTTRSAGRPAVGELSGRGWVMIIYSSTVFFLSVGYGYILSCSKISDIYFDFLKCFQAIHGQ